MTLLDLPVGGLGRVSTVIGEPLLRERLTELGFTPGIEVTVRRRAPLGDPLHVAVRGGSFAIRKDEAASIEIES